MSARTPCASFESRSVRGRPARAFVRAVRARFASRARPHPHPLRRRAVVHARARASRARASRARRRVKISSRRARRAPVRIRTFRSYTNSTVAVIHLYIRVVRAHTSYNNNKNQDHPRQRWRRAIATRQSNALHSIAPGSSAQSASMGSALVVFRARTARCASACIARAPGTSFSIAAQSASVFACDMRFFW